MKAVSSIPTQHRSIRPRLGRTHWTWDAWTSGAASARPTSPIGGPVRLTGCVLLARTGLVAHLVGRFPHAGSRGAQQTRISHRACSHSADFQVGYRSSMRPKGPLKPRTRPENHARRSNDRLYEGPSNDPRTICGPKNARHGRGRRRRLRRWPCGVPRPGRSSRTCRVVCRGYRVRVIGYTRVSTREQAIDGYGLAAQRAAIEAEAERRAWSVTWVEDEGFTARRDDRPGLQIALGALRRREAEALVVAKLDRLSRSVQHFAGFVNLASKQTWSIVALDMSLDMTTINGRLVAHILMSIAQWESEVIGHRTSVAMAEAKRQGRSFGRTRQASDDVVDRIVAARAQGSSFLAIARQLDECGIPTPGGAPHWHASTVRRLQHAHSTLRAV